MVGGSASEEGRPTWHLRPESRPLRVLLVTVLWGSHACRHSGRTGRRGRAHCAPSMGAPRLAGEPKTVNMRHGSPAEIAFGSVQPPHAAASSACGSAVCSPSAHDPTDQVLKLEEAAEAAESAAGQVRVVCTHQRDAAGGSSAARRTSQLWPGLACVLAHCLQAPFSPCLLLLALLTRAPAAIAHNLLPRVRCARPASPEHPCRQHVVACGPSAALTDRPTP